MGIPRGSARLILEESKREPFGGTVLQFGRSTVYFTHDDLRTWAELHGVQLRDVETALSHDPSAGGGPVHR